MIATLRSRFTGAMSGLIAPFDRAAAAPPDRLLPFFGWAVSGSRPVLVAAAVISALAGTVEVIAALFLGLVIDSAIASPPDRVFADNGWLFLGIAAFLLLVRPLAFGLSAAVQALAIQPNLNVLVLSRLHRWTLGQSVTFFDEDFAGRIAQKQMQAARALTDVVIEVINTVIFALASILATVILVVSIDTRAALLLLLWLAGYLAFIRHFLPRIRARSELRAAARAVVTGQIVDTVSNMRTVKLFAHDEHEDRAAMAAMGRYRDRTLAFGEVSSAFRFYLMMIAGALPVILVGSTLALWSQGLASPGDIAATGTVALRIAQMTGWVSFTLMMIYANVGEVEDGMHTLSPPHQLTDRAGAVPLASTDGVEFDGVSFAYGRQAGGVERINLAIAPGEKIGIIGASGAGKSTLVSLLLRLYDTESGAVRVGGQDIRAVTQTSLRRAIGMVTQETAMFNRSARDNIRYGRPEATDAEVEAAAARAEAHVFIEGLQDNNGRRGYDAHLGERGVKLSGGQRQRIALARALLKDAPILVLDEATSALDSESEAAIQTALNTAMTGKTVIAIAHRLSTIASMDRIVVMEDGRIVEQGSHDALLARGGTYAKYWALQSGGFLGLAADAAE